MSKRGGGPPRKDTCGNGHDLNKHGKQMWKKTADGRRVKNGRECLECKHSPEVRAADNKRHRERYREQKEVTPGEPEGGSRPE